MSSERVLVLTPLGRDGPAAVDALKRVQLPACAVQTIAGLIDHLAGGVGVLIIATEALLDADGCAQLAAALGQQPPWSEIPVVLLTPPVAPISRSLDLVRAFGPTGNLSILQRPVTEETFCGSVRFALRSRRRQYEIRDLLAQLEKATREFERSNSDLENFAHVAAHDMQEPLRTITSHLSLVVHRYQDRTLDEEAQKHLAIATDGAGRMRAMLQALLYYAQVGKGELRRSAVPLHEAIAEATKSLGGALEQSNGQVALDPELPTISADPALLALIFQNLIGNALKFHRPGVPPRIRIHARRTAKQGEIAITDNGMGIDPQHQERIFQLFQRLHPASAYPGSGIGLATCRRIVAMHGGAMWVESTPGEGSTFWFTFSDA